MTASEQDLSLPVYSSIDLRHFEGRCEKQKEPLAVLALPPIWPTYSLAEDVDLRVRRGSIWLFSNACLLVVDSIVVQSQRAGLNEASSYIVAKAASYSAFFLLSIGTVSATSAVLHLSQLRFNAFFVANRHKPADEILAGILDKHTTNLDCRRRVLGSQRLLGLSDILFATGCILLAISVCAQLFADQPVAVRACAYTVFGVALLFFAFDHGFAQRAGVWRGRGCSAR